MKESMDASEETLDRCWGIIMFGEQFERLLVEIVGVWEQERYDRVTRCGSKHTNRPSHMHSSGSSAKTPAMLSPPRGDKDR